MKGKGGVGVLIAMKPSSGPPPPRFGGGKPEPKGDDPAPSPVVEATPRAQPQLERAGAGIGPDEVDYSDNDLCGSCEYNQQGQCSKYQFPVDDTGHCEAGYEPRGGTDRNEIGPEGLGEEHAAVIG